MERELLAVGANGRESDSPEKEKEKMRAWRETEAETRFSFLPTFIYFLFLFFLLIIFYPNFFMYSLPCHWWYRGVYGNGVYMYLFPL